MPTPAPSRDDTTVILDRVVPVIALVLTVTALVSAERRVGAAGDVRDWAWLLPAFLGGLLLLRRRAPVAVLVASVAAVIGYYATGQPAIGLELPLAAAFFSTAERGRTRATIGMALLVLVIAYGYRVGIAKVEFAALLGLDIMTSIVVLSLAIAAGDGVRSRAAERTANAERYQLQTELVEENLRAETDAERRALARDVHDVLGHAMVVVSTQANVALESIADQETTSAALRNIKHTAQQSLRDIRGSVALLSGGQQSERRPVGTLADLGELAARFEGTGLTIEIRSEGDLATLPAAVSSTAYRVIQEAVTNSVRHGAARRVDITLGRTQDTLQVTVRDDGRGAGAFTMGHGLRGMQDRVAMLGGSVHAGPGPENGFHVQARIPLAPARREAP
ncbi:sensor histidine kinase [Nostocoides australiense]|nr:sensor histidine kinase [Actinomycetota bacterium]MCB1300859.1 sensor histidine kinase [Tetrasphaera sp.]HPF82275.1 sensor histidine kinase [Tetrasphaera australiensis]HRW01845.1 sensor histidine kinase [Tetrasphaera sp.]